MAIGGDRLSGLQEMANYGNRRRPVSQVFRCSSTWEDETVILIGIHFVQPEIGFHAIAGFLGVSVEARLEVVYHRKESSLLESRDLNFPALFFEAVLGVIDLLRLSSITGQQEDLEHGEPLRRRPSPRSLSEKQVKVDKDLRR